MTKLADVAKLAGVSPATVSRVVNEPGLVREDTRLRVEGAIRQLGYRPSRVARRLRVRGGASALIGLVIPDLQNPFFADLARGVEDAALRHGYNVLIGNADEDPEKEGRYLQVMAAESVEGVIVPPSASRSPVAEDLARAGVPVVCVDRRLAGVRLDVATIDNVRGAYDATAHLLAGGHQRIAFIHGRAQLSTSRERLEGYRNALGDYGIPFDSALVCSGDSRQSTARTAAAELLALQPRPTALLAGNGLMTLGALEAIQEAELGVPDDVAVVGYDDMPWAVALDLTVVRQPGHELGEAAAGLLMLRIADPSRAPAEIKLESELVVRGSSVRKEETPKWRRIWQTLRMG